jgi:hypothetical protein
MIRIDECDGIATEIDDMIYNELATETYQDFVKRGFSNDAAQELADYVLHGQIDLPDEVQAAMETKREWMVTSFGMGLEAAMISALS